MAKVRQTDVNINYKVNTVDVERGNGLLAKASKATDDLRKTTQQFNTQAAAGYKFQSRAIEGMEIEVARLRQRVKLANTQNAAEVQKLSAQYRSAKQQLDQYNKSLLQTQNATKQTSTSSRDLAGQFGQVYTAIKLIIAAGLARELVSMSISAATLTGNVEGVERAFNRAFPEGKSLLNELRAATHGAVNDFELMQRTLQATNLGVSVEHLPVLFEFAATRAQQTGESVDYLVDSIVRGIGRKSVLVLDNLGLSTTRLKQQFDGAAIASKSVGEVTAGVAEIARVELDKMGGYLETSKTHVDQLAVAWRELREETSKALTEGGGGGFIGFLKDYVNQLRVWFKAMNQGKDVTEVFEEELRSQIATISASEFMTRRLTESKEENIAILKEEIQAITEDLGVYTRFRDQISAAIDDKAKEAKGLVDKGNAAAREIEQIQEFIALNERMLKSKQHDALIDQEILKILQSKLIALQKVNKEQGGAPGERQKPPKEVTQVVDIRFRNPVTGAISKENFGKVMEDFSMAAQQVVDSLPPVSIKIQPFIPIEDWERALEENKSQIVDTTTSIIQDQIDSILRADVDAFSARIDAARDFYSEQIELAGDNERAKDQLRIKEDRAIKKLEQQRADREKKAAKAGIRVSTALGIMKVFAGEGTFADKIIKALIVAAQGASQLLVADRARYYAKGEIDIKGPGTKTSDSIPAMLSKGESIMTADETMASKGILKAVRARKLSDKVLQDIVSGRSGGAVSARFDDSKIVKELQEIKKGQPDIIQRANVAYEVRQKGDNYKQIVRSKSFRK